MLFFGYVILFLLYRSYGFGYDIYYPKSENREQLTVSNEYYDNLRIQGKRINQVSIQSNIVYGNFLQLFLKYDVDDNDVMSYLCPELKSFKQEGLHYTGGGPSGDLHLFGFEIRFGSKRLAYISQMEYEKQNASVALKCISDIYEIYINDSLCQNLNYYYHVHPNHNEKGIITMINTDQLNKGSNILTIKKYDLDGDSLFIDDYVFIPFWKE